jgi:hypothetical protein
MLQITQVIKANFSTSFVNYIQDGINNTIIDNNLNTQKNIVNHWDSKVSISKKINHSFDYNFGAQLEVLAVKNQSINHRINFSRKINQFHQNIYIFTQFNYTTDKINGFIATRFSYYDFLKNKIIEPRLLFQYQFNSKLNLFIKSEIKSQNLNQVEDLENNFLGIEKRKWYLANDSIAPVQKSFQAEIGGVWKHKKTMASASCFYKKVSGITTYSQGFQNLNQFDIEFGEVNNKGILLHLNTSISKIKTWISYSYFLNEYYFSRLNPSSFSANNLFKNRIISGISYTWKGFNLASTFEWYNGKPFTPIDSENPIDKNKGFYEINYNTINSEILPDYSRLDISISKKFELKTYNLNINFGIINILNTKNFLNKHYTIRNNLPNIQTLDYYGLRFTPNLALQISLK